MTTRTKQLLVNVAKYAILAVVIAYVVLAMRHEFAKTTRADWARLRPDGWLILASAMGFVGVNSVQMVRYRSLLLAYGARPTWRQMAAIAWLPPLGKYVPGSVWALMGAIAMLRRFGIDVAIAVSVVVMVDAFSEIVGLLFSVPLLLRPPISERFPAGRWLAPICLLAGVAVLAPPIFNRLIAVALRLFKRPPLARMPTWREYAVPVLTAIAQWLFAGASLWLMVRAFTPIAPGLYVQLTMVAACALAVGYLFFIAPAGLGAREGILLALLPPLLADAPAGTVTFVIIAMRLMQVIVEVSLAGVGALMLRLETQEGRNTNRHESENNLHERIVS